MAARGHLSPGSSGETHNSKPFFPARVDCPRDVWRTSGSRDRDQDISWTAQAEDLPLEHSVIAVIVADRGKHRAIGSQGDGCRRGSVIVEPRQHLPAMC